MFGKYYIKKSPSAEGEAENQNEWNNVKKATSVAKTTTNTQRW